MSVLAAVEPSSSAVTDAPRILSFLDSVACKPLSDRQDIVTRARLLHRNCKCRTCGRATVDPVERDDALLNRAGLEIPGSATLIGFACRACGHRWSAERPILRIYG